MSKLSIVLPSFNEEPNINHTAQVLVELLTTEKINYELVFISDGSSDNTYEEILKLSDSNENIKGAKFLK